MLRTIIETCARHRGVTLFLGGLLAASGLYALRHIPLDAVPDLSDVQVIVLTEYPGQGPQVVEDQVTYPLSTAMLSVPFAKSVRGYSFFGLSMVYVIFADGTDLYWARSRVLEYLNAAGDRLPPGVSPRLGPDATGVGWVYEYVLEDTSGVHDLADLRSVQDWYLRYELSSVPGVSEVASIGGFVKQYQVVVDPDRLLSFGIPLSRVRRALQRSNNDVGGRLLEMGEAEFMVRSRGYFTSLDDIGAVAVGLGAGGVPVRLRDIAEVRLGPELRRGVAEWNGRGEIVGGIVVMRYGENALAVIERVKQRLEELGPGLPPGVRVRTAYDRSVLIGRAVDNLQEKLLEEIAIVAAVCLVFLLHLRSALVAALTLPLGVLAAFVAMRLQGINADIMSLGGIAIAIGVMVDAAVVMIENAHKHIERDDGKKPHWRLVADAAAEVGPALFYSLLIVTLSFLPVFALESQEGRLFKPLAYTKTYAMAAAALLALTVVPALMVFCVRGRLLPEKRNPVSRLLVSLYRPLIRAALRRKGAVLALCGLALFVSLFPFGTLVAARWDAPPPWAERLGRLFPVDRIGSEFMPPLDEGDLLYMPTTLPGVSAAKAKEILQQTDRLIASFPEVETVFGKVGRAETATDPAPLSMIETTITLKPRDQWRPGMTPEKLVEELDQALRFPGLTNAWTMPIKTRTDMLSTGIKTPVGVKIAGPDPDTLEAIGRQVESALRRLPSTQSAYAERAAGGRYLDIDIRREEIARYGLTIGDVQDVISGAIGGMNITQVVEGRERYPLSLRYGRDRRDDIPALRQVLVPTPSGAQIPLGQLADIALRPGPPVIKSENARPNAWVYVDIRDTDIGTYVKRARRAVADQVTLPPGYSIAWSGQFEYMQRANQRLTLIVPLTLAVIFLLLYLNFGNITESLLVMLSLPFALVGGVWLLYLLDYNMSIAAGIGFIALAGLAAETGVVMLVYLDQAWEEKRRQRKNPDTADLYAAVLSGAAERVRPKIMTVASTLLGLLPIMWGTGTGSEVMQRIAAPMVGGLLSSAVLTLLVIPVLYALWRERSLRSPHSTDI